MAILNIVANISLPLQVIVYNALVGHTKFLAYLGTLSVGAMIFNFLYFGLGSLSMGTYGFKAQALDAKDQSEAGLIFL